MNLIKDKINKMYYVFLASAIGSTIVTTIYTTVDLICVGHYSGPVGSAAISCINPLWSIMIAPGVLAGIGGSVMMANRRGAGQIAEGNQYFTVSFFLSVIFSAVISLCYILFPIPLLRFFGAEGEVLRHGVAYMKSVAIASPAFTMCACLSSFLRNDGEAITPTVATITGGVVNIILDVLLVFDFGAGLGTFGAGLATSIGQLVSFIIVMTYFLRKKCRLRLVFPKKILGIIGKIFSVGIAAFVLDMSFGVTTAAYNKVIIHGLGQTELAIYGALACVLSMFYCLMSAAGVAMQPITAANFGAGKLARVKQTFNLSLLCAAVMGVLFFAVSQLFPGEILKLYMSVDADVMEKGPEIVRMYTSGVLVAGATIVLSYYLQSVLRQTASLVISLLRGMLLPVLYLMLLPQILSYHAIWWSIPLSELSTLVVALVYLYFKKHRASQETHINP